MIQDWMRYCVRMGVEFDVANRGIDIMMQLEPDGTRPNIAYYQEQGWLALLNAAESSLKNPIPRWKS